MIYSSNSKKVLKAQEITLTSPPDAANHKQNEEGARACFIRDKRRAPGNETDLNVRGNTMDISFGIEEPGTRIEERSNIAVKEAYNKGFSEGMVKGVERKKKELSSALESVTELVKKLTLLKETFLKSSEKEIIDLVFLIAEKVIHKEVSTDREVVLSVLNDMVKNIHEEDDIVIRLNPRDYSYIKEVKPDFFDNYGEMSIRKDNKIGQGGAVIETRWGTVDAGMDQQLDKIRYQVSEIRDSRLADYKGPSIEDNKVISF